MDTVHILLVEDNEGDIVLTKEAIEEANAGTTVSVARDGEEAIAFLTNPYQFTPAGYPDIVLLDINLPRRNGHEVLHFIKESDTLRYLPVIMLTTSSYEKDINEAYKNQANCYISKSVEIGDFLDVIAKVLEFWIKVVKLPTINH